MIWTALAQVTDMPQWTGGVQMFLDLLPLIVAVLVAAVLYHLDGRYAKKAQTASLVEVNGLGKRVKQLEEGCSHDRSQLRDLQEHYRTQEERIEVQRQYMERHIVRPIDAMVERLNAIGEKQVKTDAKLDQIAKWMKE
jgi:hypothetical protein